MYEKNRCKYLFASYLSNADAYEPYMRQKKRRNVRISHEETTQNNNNYNNNNEPRI